MKEKLYAEIISSMKNKDKERLEVLRMVKGAIQLEEIKNKAELTDEDVVIVLGKQIKTRRESIEEFKKGNREDLVNKTAREIEILNEYMPEQMDEASITKLVKEAIQELKPTSPSDMGKIMGFLNPKVKGKADMGMVSKIVKENLSNL